MTENSTSEKRDLISELKRQRQLVIVWSARRWFLLAFVLIVPFLALRWHNGEPSWGLALEALAFLGSGLWLYWLADRDPRKSTIIMLSAFGLVYLFSLIQFGPIMGVGFLGFAWMIAMASLLDLVWRAATMTTLAVVMVAAATYLGWQPNWEVQLDTRGWIRSTLSIAIICFAGARVIRRMNQEVVSAWERESTAQQKRADSERIVMRSQRLESIGKLAGGVAHDFNNSLAVLVAGIDALKTADTDAQRDMLLDNMEQAAHGAVATTRQLLSLSRQGIEPGHHSTMPQQALEALIPNLSRLFPENIRILAGLQATAEVALSGGDLEQVVLNLCLNARDAMPAGGELAIRCAQDNETVIIEVTDSGEGMDNQTRERALGAFFTTKSSGTGLGLALVNETLNAVGGDISITSVPGKGTTVTLRMPALTNSTATTSVAPRLPSAPATPTLNGAVKLLLLEDDPMVREMYGEVLRQAELQVDSVETVAQACAAIAAEDYTLFVTDAMLPDGEPSSAIKLFRANGWKPVLVCSGYIDSDQLVKDLGQSDYEFLQKPFPNALLTDTVNKLLQESRKRYAP